MNELNSKVTYPLWIWDRRSNGPSVKCDNISDLVGEVENSDSEEQKLTILDDFGRRCFVETDQRLELLRFDVIDEEPLPEFQAILTHMKAELT